LWVSYLRALGPRRPTDGFGQPPSKANAVRPLPTLAAVLVLGASAAVALAATVTAAGAPPRPVPASVLVVTDVGEGAQGSLPAALWRKLATEYVGARGAAAEDGTALPDDARCRTAHAIYAVLATFDRATRLPGLAQDTDRLYGVARFTVRNCLAGTVAPTKTVRIESDPIAGAERAGDGTAAERIWERAIRAALARDPLVLAAVARVARVENGFVYLESSGGFAPTQVLRVFADASAKPYAKPVELIVLDVVGTSVRAAIVGKGTPRPGDYVDAAPGPATGPAK
jgi:hypothetical protein